MYNELNLSGSPSMIDSYLYFVFLWKFKKEIVSVKKVHMEEGSPVIISTLTVIRIRKFENLTVEDEEIQR